jgi:hypothetical protein
MSGKRKAAREASEIARRGAELAERRYQLALSGNYNSQVEKMGKNQLASAKRGLMGSARGQRNPFQRALGMRGAQQAYSNMMPQSLGQLASAKAQEQLGMMGAAQGHQFGMMSQQAQKNIWS